MLTDALSANGMKVPAFDEEDTKELLAKLNPGSSVGNPIDFLATGTAEQLGEIIDFCDNYDRVDGMVVVFGSPGLFNVKDVYEVLDKKMKTSKKPIFPVLPSVINAADEIKSFLAKGRVNFPDEVSLGKALAHINQSSKIVFDKAVLPDMDFVAIRSLINSSPNGFLSPEACRELLEATGIDMAQQMEITDQSEIPLIKEKLQFPIVMKVTGPVHKTEVGGVILNIANDKQAEKAFHKLMAIPDAKAVLIQEMLVGEELYCGATEQGDFGHVVLCGLGGIFLELLNDTASALAPMSEKEVLSMVKSLKAYPLFEGYRNRKSLNRDKFVDVVRRVGALVHIAPEIVEMDLNPLIADDVNMRVVDVRVRIER